MKSRAFGLFMIAIVSAAVVTAQDTRRPLLGAWGVDLSGMDGSVRAGDDFFRNVNGKWYEQAVIPPDRTRTGDFDDLSILSESREMEVVDDLEARDYKSLNSEEKQLRDLYDAFMDVDAIEKKGLSPAEKVLQSISSIQTLDAVARMMGERRAGIFTIGVGPNPKDSTSYILSVGHSGLSMPDRDYYLRDDKALQATRDAFRKYLTAMLEMSGTANEKTAQARADAVFGLETKIAELHWTAAEQRDADKTYNPMTAAELEKFAPDFPWKSLFAAEAIPLNGPKGPRTLVVRQKSAFPGLAKLFAATDVTVWRDYLTIQYLSQVSAYLPKRFDDADFEFFGKIIGGQQQQLERKKRAVRLLDARLGHPLGKIYVARYFPPASKLKVEALVANLLKAYDADIRTIPWMTDATRQRALDKLHAFTPHIGYPDNWRDYSDLSIRRSDLVEDIERIVTFERRYRLDRLDAPVDRNEWSMTPPTVNANYSPPLNSIFFPAAILQPPFFDPNADDAVNYGGIGVVIGHEISHGFDDQGSKRDGAGNLNNWWTDVDRRAFDERTARLGAQYDTYEALPGLHVNGKLTMGENIGDLSGVAIALKAYHLSLVGQTAPVIDGYTGDQRFFLSYGQIWREKVAEARVRRNTLSDPHSPPEFRVIGITRNIDAWYDAFNVKPGERYYLAPEERVRLW